MESWRDLNDIIFHDNQPPLEGEMQQPLSRCNQLGLCVCEGQGLRAWLFHSRLALFLRSEFTPKRQKRQRNIAGVMVPVDPCFSIAVVLVLQRLMM